MLSVRPTASEYARRNCFEFRIGIEGEAAAMAARWRTAEDLARLRGIMTHLEMVREAGRLGLDEDFSFHLAIARASANDYFVSVLMSFKETIRGAMVLARAPTGPCLREKLAAINRQHTAIFDAIRAKDEVGARRAMRDHLMRCKRSTSHWDLVPAT